MSTQAPVWAAPANVNSRSRRWTKNFFLYFLLFIIGGYACLGRGFAYLGIAPLYVGELCLLLGLVTTFGRRARWRQTLRLPTTLLLILFLIWGALRTLPYVSVYGLDTLRDGVIWGYGFFALIVAARMIAREDYFNFIFQVFYKFSKVYLLLCPFLWAYNVYLVLKLPPIFWGRSIRFEEALVWLAAIAALVFTRVFPYNFLWIVLLCADTMLFFTANRAGMLAFAAVIMLCWLTNPLSRRLWITALVTCVVVIVLALLDVRINMNRRELSIQQLTTNVISIFSSDSPQTEEQGTKEWRLSWWRQIVDYTFFGDYFWDGKGFGINLSNDDNHKLDYGRGNPNQLRSPHNSHLSILAREGVPGLMLWLILNLTWGVSLFYRLMHAKAAGRDRWAAFILLLLSLWLAIMIIMSFGVVLEGPMMGIPFWTVYGIGISVLYTYGRRPYLMDGVPAHLRAPMPPPAPLVRPARDPVLARRFL